MFGGGEITGLSPEVINRRGRAKTFQITNIFPGISVYDNVRVAAESRVPVSGRVPSLWRVPDVEAPVMDLLGAFGLTLLLIEHDMSVVMGISDLGGRR